MFSAFEVGMIKYAKKDLIRHGGLHLDERYPWRVIREAWRQARIVLGV